jgi:hypothetical protein
MPPNAIYVPTLEEIKKKCAEIRQDKCRQRKAEMNTGHMPARPPKVYRCHIPPNRR